MKRETRIIVGGGLMVLALSMCSVEGMGLWWYLLCTGVMLKAERVVNGSGRGISTGNGEEGAAAPCGTEKE